MSSRHYQQLQTVVKSESQNVLDKDTSNHFQIYQRVLSWRNIQPQPTFPDVQPFKNSIFKSAAAHTGGKHLH